MKKELLRKYNVPGPRYTSYPTIPYWDEMPPTIKLWKKSVRETFEETNNSGGISLYIHLPFCERLCTFCGCNKRITVNHSVEQPYIKTILKEWKMYLEVLGETPNIREIHLGGGTPTFFSAANLKNLLEEILSSAKISSEFEFGLEAHPNVTNAEHLQTLYELGFRRVSFGVQDFSPKVQEIINRHQSYEKTLEVTQIARQIGYTSINYDLVFGLPLQTKETIKDTIEKVQKIRPERIAFYSYAHVPWVSPGQRRFTEMDLPSGEEKRMLYEIGRDMLEEAGYFEIGMDHFSLENDELYLAQKNKTLHRNFMGYTSSFTKLMIGLGVSSISDSWTAFSQNNKTFEEYVEIIESGNLPVFKEHILSEEDLVLRKHILSIMCKFETSWKESSLQHPVLFEGLKRMNELEEDGLVKISEDKLQVTNEGKPLLRNICMCLDDRLWKKQPKTQLFSQTI